LELIAAAPVPADDPPNRSAPTSATAATKRTTVPPLLLLSTDVLRSGKFGLSGMTPDGE
jgi:hypothetical protein